MMETVALLAVLAATILLIGVIIGGVALVVVSVRKIRNRPAEPTEAQHP